MPDTAAFAATTSNLTFANYWDHILARWGVRRGGHRVAPGLYALGDPGPDSPVFVTANYTLSFDALRAALRGLKGWILVLDTKGINVWCAAGKGTFGTDELVERIEAAGLAGIVRHRVLILPQLGAPGVAAHEVRERTGFAIEYGPVRAADLPAYLRDRRAAPAMRLVRFGLRDRLALIPVEFVHVLPFILFALVLRFYGLVAALFAGTVLFPVLLPWLPGRAFSAKGFFLGLAAALPFAAAAYLGDQADLFWWRAGRAIQTVMICAPIVAFLALNFTGSTPFTSRTGVRREIFRYIPIMAWTFGLGLIWWLAHTAITLWRR